MKVKELFKYYRDTPFISIKVFNVSAPIGEEVFYLEDKEVLLENCSECEVINFSILCANYNEDVYLSITIKEK